MTVGLFVGRFQPFHLGHLKAVEWALGKVTTLVLAIGSAQKCYEPDNPLTVGERVEVIHRVMKARAFAGRVLIVPIPDVNNNALWVAHVNSLVPKYDLVFTNNPLAKKLFKDHARKKVLAVPLFDRKKLDATRIRKSLLKGDVEWRKLVPPEVEQFLLKNKISERVREVAGGDKV